MRAQRREQLHQRIAARTRHLTRRARADQVGELFGRAPLANLNPVVISMAEARSRQLAVEAIKARDYPIVQGAVLYIAMAYVVINLMVDLLYAWVDPKLRSRYR